jgi:serine protease Do
MRKLFEHLANLSLQTTEEIRMNDYLKNKSLRSRLLLSIALIFCLNPILAEEADSTALDFARKLNQAFIEVVDSVAPAVVVIQVAHAPRYSQQSLLRQFYPPNHYYFLPPEMKKQLENELKDQAEQDSAKEPENTKETDLVWDGQGSGIVIRSNGYILTNSHVIDQAKGIRVRLKNGEEHEAIIKGVDKHSDIAVLKIEASDLPVVKFGDSSLTKVGEFAIAIGAPFSLDYTVTVGHVSAKGRHDLIPSYRHSINPDQNFIQTDASINPGNSGGPLVNIEGEVIGINTIIRGINTGIGFAVPINLARNVSNQLIDSGKVSRAWLGILIMALKDSEDRNSYEGVKDGLIVTQIDPKGPASKSDLKINDVITAVDGTRVKLVHQLQRVVRFTKPGQEVILDIVRDGEPLQIKAATAELTESAVANFNDTLYPESNKDIDLGLSVEAISAEIAKSKGLDNTKGVVVVEVKPDSLADKNDLKAGDIITEIDNRPISEPTEFKQAIQNADLQKGIIVILISDGVSKFKILKDSGD